MRLVYCLPNYTHVGPLPQFPIPQSLPRAPHRRRGGRSSARRRKPLSPSLSPDSGNPSPAAAPARFRRAAFLLGPQRYRRWCGGSGRRRWSLTFREALGAVVSELRHDVDGVAVHQVDAHNVVPVWAASGKLENSARTFRGKMNKVLDQYLVEFPELKEVVPWDREQPEQIDWDVRIHTVCREAEDVPEIDWCEPGEAAAMEALLGSKDGFLVNRMKSYDTDRNFPTKPRALSGLSPYLHFGHISAQRCALEAKKHRHLGPKSVDAFLEELIIRRELADNFCYYQPHYDTLADALEWARKTLMDHASDKRERIYTSILGGKHHSGSRPPDARAASCCAGSELAAEESPPCTSVRQRQQFSEGPPWKLPAVASVILVTRNPYIPGGCQGGFLTFRLQAPCGCELVIR